MVARFDYGPIRALAVNLLAQFGRPTPIVLLRNVNEIPGNPSMPWRGDTAHLRTFQFLGTASTLGFPKKSDPIMDADLDVIAPGSLATTPADSPVPTPAFPPDLGLSMAVTLKTGTFASMQAGEGLGISMKAALSLTPLCGFPVITDRLFIDGQYYAILGVQDISPDDIPIIFKMRCRAWPGLPKQGGVPY